jgi:hypothetical protein
VDYTYWPDFLVPFVRPSVPTLRTLYEAWVSSGHLIREAIDEVVAQFRDEYFLGIAVAYSWLTRISQGLILHWKHLKIRAPESTGALALRGYSVVDVRPLFEAERLWRSSQPTVFSPP